MITVQSSPLISNEELGSYLQPFGKIEAIVQKNVNLLSTWIAAFR